MKAKPRKKATLLDGQFTDNTKWLDKKAVDGVNEYGFSDGFLLRNSVDGLTKRKPRNKRIPAFA